MKFLNLHNYVPILELYIRTSGSVVRGSWCRVCTYLSAHCTIRSGVVKFKPAYLRSYGSYEIETPAEYYMGPGYSVY